MTDRSLSAEQRKLKPWPAGVAMLVCGCVWGFLWVKESWSAAAAMGFMTGMWAHDWIYRMRDKYDPNREIGADTDG